jgi:uncharacterized membrane-anchored protein YhcB (DUF1043 family)
MEFLVIIVLSVIIGMVTTSLMLGIQAKNHEKAMTETLNILDNQIKISRKANEESAELLNKMTKKVGRS